LTVGNGFCIVYSNGRKRRKNGKVTIALDPDTEDVGVSRSLNEIQKKCIIGDKK
jgi:hypothetical protein